MSRFNTRTDNTRTDTTNAEGAPAYTQSPELALVSHLQTSLVGNQFYRSEQQGVDQLAQLLEDVSDKKFAAQATIFARREMGMRTVSHLAAVNLIPHASGTPWGANFFERIADRPDDMTEIYAAWMASHGYTRSKRKRLPHAMSKGFGRALAKLDAYRLAKYAKKGHEISLVDLVNLCHPKPNGKGGEALASLVAGTLKPAETWETKQTRAGQQATSAADKAAKKQEAWGDLITSGKIGYMALLRNLRNIATDAPEHLTAALAILTDAKRVQKSRVFPHQFLIAYRLFTLGSSEMNLDGQTTRQVIGAISIAIDHALANVPQISGRTLVAIDSSSSMTMFPINAKPDTRISWSSRVPVTQIPCADMALLLGTALAKTNNADLWGYDGSVSEWQYNPADSTIGICTALAPNIQGGATHTYKVFDLAAQKKVRYDRILILSDQEGYGGGISNRRSGLYDSLRRYQKHTGAQPHVYIMDLAGGGTSELPPSSARVHYVPGFSDKVFDMIGQMKQDPQYLMKKIRAIEI